MEHKNDKTIKTVGSMMLIMLLGKVLGIVREMCNSYTFGTASVEGTAFKLASLIPRQFLDIMFASAISACFIPVFNTYLEKKGRDDAYRLAHNFISIILLFSSLITAVCVVFSPFIIQIMAGGVAEETGLLAVSLLRVLFPILIFSGVAFSLTGILQSFGEFNIPAAMSVVSNAIIIVYYIFFLDTFGVYGLCAAYLLGWGSQMLIQFPFLIKNKFRYRFHIDLKEPGIKEIFRLMLPVMVSTWAAPINVLVNTRAVAHLYGGSGDAINGLDYANTLYTVITGVFVLSVANVIFPKLSRQSAGDDEAGFTGTLRTTLRSLFFLLIPMTFGLAALSGVIVRVFYERGEFGAFSTQVTSRALFYFSFGIIGYGLQTILSRAFYSQKEGKTPLLTALLAMVINFIMSFALVDHMEIGGPALASSVSITVVSIVMLVVICKKNKGVFDRRILSDVVKMAAAGSVMLLLVVFLRDAMEGALGRNAAGGIITAAGSACAGLVVYMALTYLLRIDEARYGFEYAVKVVKKAGKIIKK